MPKLKTHSGAKKRIKTSAGGKLMRRHAFKGHFLSKKSASRKREFSKDHGVHKSDESNVRQLLGK